MSGWRSSYRWQQAQAECLRINPPICWICERTIDMTLRSPHPMSASVDHVIPAGDGGPLFDQNNLRPAHRTCNVSRGNRTRRTARTNSRAW